MAEFYGKLERILERVDERVATVSSRLKAEGRIDSDDIFFDNEEFIRVMNISKRTAQQWRDNKIVSFSQVGGKIYYKLSDIKKLLNDNYNPSKS